MSYRRLLAVLFTILCVSFVHAKGSRRNHETTSKYSFTKKTTTSTEKPEEGSVRNTTESTNHHSTSTSESSLVMENDEELENKNSTKSNHTISTSTTSKPDSEFDVFDEIENKQHTTTTTTSRPCSREKYLKLTPKEPQVVFKYPQPLSILNFKKGQSLAGYQQPMFQNPYKKSVPFSAGTQPVNYQYQYFKPSLTKASSLDCLDNTQHTVAEINNSKKDMKYHLDMVISCYLTRIKNDSQRSAQTFLVYNDQKEKKLCFSVVKVNMYYRVLEKLKCYNNLDGYRYAVKTQGGFLLEVRF